MQGADHGKGKWSINLGADRSDWRPSSCRDVELPWGEVRKAVDRGVCEASPKWGVMGSQALVVDADSRVTRRGFLT